MLKPSLLIVDDSSEMLDVLGRYFGDHGFSVETASSADHALRAYRDRPTDVVLTDLRMAGLDGLDLLDEIRRADPAAAIVIMTAFGNVESAVYAIQRGAFHYVTKPFKMAAVRVLLERAARQRRGGAGDGATVSAATSSPSLVGESEAFREVRRLIERAANAASPVLIEGETGTGKDSVARALHQESRRRARPFVVVSGGATGALRVEGGARVPRSQKPEQEPAQKEAVAISTWGEMFVEAQGGTLFFDEVADLSPADQAKLLQLLQANEQRAASGGEATGQAARCVAATRRDLSALVREGRFREDLFFRLAVVPIRLPPLRERRGDVPLLLDHFVRRLDDDRPVPSRADVFSDAAVEVLDGHAWPGNVRELGNLVERLTLLCAGRAVSAEDARRALPQSTVGDAFDWLAANRMSLEDVERRYIAAVLSRANGQKSKAAEILHVDVSTLYRREKGPRS